MFAVKQKSFFEIYQSIRRDWGNVNPVTKVIPNKKKYRRKDKHKKNYKDEI